jgi:hypothetical protein
MPAAPAEAIVGPTTAEGRLRNPAGEPIVYTMEDAIATFLRSSISIPPRWVDRPGKLERLTSAVSVAFPTSNS